MDIKLFLLDISNIMDDKDFVSALKKWGFNSREDMIIEESAELTQAIMHRRRRNKSGTESEVLEEAIDVLLTVLSLIHALNNTETIRMINQKYMSFLSKLYDE
jgi:NTP pyrophosphatase (non-canonical NTP hydrolase)